MIYSLLLKDGSSYSLNGGSVTLSLAGSLTLQDVAFQKSSNIIERSYGDGSAKVGDSRLLLNELSIVRELVFSSDEEARNALNELFAAFKDAEYLVDETNELRTRIDVTSPSVSWEEGAYFRSGTLTTTLFQLVPYWEAVSPQEDLVAVEAGVPSEISITNSGYAEVPFLAEVTVDSQETAVSLVEVQNLYEGRAMIVESASFGLDNFNKMRIDNIEGLTLLINEEQRTELDEQESIQAGAGYFNLLRGVNVLSLRCSVAASFVFAHRARFYV